MNRWFAAFCLLMAGSAAPVAAQGLIWKLPDDGTWIRYEGTYKQIESRASTGGKDVEIEWIQHLTIKSVGTEKAEYEGKEVDCRWLEFKVQTGKKSDAGINPGPVGQAIYKVLVPEMRILGIGKTIDDETIPVSFLPIVKGFRKDGAKDVEPIKGSVFQMFPKVALIRHYPQMEKDGGEDSLDLPAGAVTAQRWKGKHEAENLTHHTVQEADLWTSPESPFGLAQWSIKITMERKEDKEPRTAFQQESQTLAEMKQLEVGTDAKSELEAQ